MRMLFFLAVVLISCAPESSDVRTEPPTVAPPAGRPVAETEPTVAVDTSTFDLTYLTGKFDPAQHPDFVKVAPQYTDGDPYVLHQDTYAAFERMHAAARADGVVLTIVSATRNFNRQKSIWEAKWTGSRRVDGGENLAQTTPDPAARALRILNWSSMPGTSRHHWGTDIDLNALNNDYFATGQGLRVYEWLVANGPTFGFCQPYSPKGHGGRAHGYNEEKWHWSYLPLAKQLTHLAQTQLQDHQIDGFLGAETAPQIRVVERYVLGINPDCL